MYDDENLPPVPTLALWKLLKRFPLPFNKGGEPKPGSEDLHEAHATVREWLAKTELELGCPSFADSADHSEYDTTRQRYGLCPKCRRNDGYLMVDDRFWSFCHAHCVRWEIGADVIEGFILFGEDQWDDEERPVGRYTRVIPLHVAKSEPQHERVRVEALEAKETEQGDSPRRPKLHLVEPDPPYEWPKDDRDDVEIPAGRDYTLGIFPLLYLLLVVIPKDLVAETLEWFEDRRERREWSAMNRQ